MTRAVFVHGAGRGGIAAWPEQRAIDPGVDAAYVERVGWRAGEEDLPTDFAEDRRRVVEALGPGGHLVAHSYGAIAALMAAATAPHLVRSVVLFEPACLSLARGRPAVEAHISVVSRAFAQPRLSDESFMGTFFGSLGGGMPPGPLSDDGHANARRLRRQRGPWEAELAPSTIGRHPTLVVTGGSSAMSDEVAEALELLGARRTVLGGHGHRPQDHRDANALLRQFWAEAR